MRGSNCIVCPRCVDTVIIAPVGAVDTAVDVDAIEYEGLDDGSLRIKKPVDLASVSCGSGRGNAKGVPLTDMIASLFLGCRRGYVGVLGGRMGLKTVDAGLNCEVCLTGEAGRDLDGDASLTGDIARFTAACNTAFPGRFCPPRVGVLRSNARPLLAFGVGFTGEAGASRAK